MKHILKAITDHPEAFELTLDQDKSDKRLLQIIYSAKQLGTTVQQNSMTITKLYFGWTILVKLGLRAIAMPMGEEMLQNFNWNNHYNFAADICNHLMKHYYILGIKEEADKYESMFREYHATYTLEAEMESLYLEVIYKNDHGLKINKASIEKDMAELESRLQHDSCKYHFYYYQCKCIINTNEEFEKWCLLGLAYFKNLYFKHEIYYNVFIKSLYTYYLSIEEYNRVKDELPEYVNETLEGSNSWYRLKYIQIMALLNTAKIDQAYQEIAHCLNLKGFIKLSKAHQEEWEYLAEVISRKTDKKIISLKKA